MMFYIYKLHSIAVVRHLHRIRKSPELTVKSKTRESKSDISLSATVSTYHSLPLISDFLMPGF